MTIALGVVQMAMSDVLEENVAKAMDLVRQAASRGATAVLLPELFEGYYWPQAQRERFFDRAHPVDGHPFIGRFQALARELGVVLPLSFFEKAGHAHYNTLVMIDATGETLGLYRKSHIPDGPGYMEKYYFAPGDTGFKAFPTRSGTLGAAICWDQWYPETARVMALQGAEVLLYPTAIGSEPDAAGPMDTSKMWRRVMVGHAVANACYLGAANRVGTESIEATSRRSTARASSATSAARWWPRPIAPRKRCWSRRSSWIRHERSAPAWASSGIAAPTCTGRS